jgi:hypothetical protein
MGRKFIIVSLTTMVLTGIICPGFCIADNWGSVDYSEIKAKKEAKIKSLASMDVQRAFEELQKPSFMSDRKGLKGAIRTGFKDREGLAVATALKTVESIQSYGGKSDQGRKFYISKMVLATFPEKSVEALNRMYRISDSNTKGNVIKVLGALSKDGQVKHLLVEALDNKAFCEEEDPEIVGCPLRVCDVAYNQLVLRHGIKGVLRTIGTSHRMEVRDYHINILKKQL